MTLCAHCSMMFHTGPGNGNDGCNCMMHGCGCRIRREACICGEINTRHCPVHGQEAEERPSPIAFEWRDSQPVPETSSTWDNPS